MKIINVMDYVTVVNDKKLKGSGLVRGDILMVSANKVAPVKQSDPYLQRVYFLCIRVVDGEHQVPNENNDYKIYLVDPRNLELLEDKETLDHLRDELNKQYGHDESEKSDETSD